MTRVAAVGARVAYGALFVVLLPALLVLWARRLDALMALPALRAPLAGAVVAAAGALLMAAAAWALWRHGGGLPMSAFPPGHLVTRGPYRVVADPIYVGAVTVAVGASLAAGSAAGLWIVTPIFTLACAAWVCGFERDLTRRRFGSVAQPLLRLPPPGDAPPSVAERASAWTLAFVPWFVLYMGVELLGVPPDARSSWAAADSAAAVIPWTEAIYFAVYPVVVLAPFAARRQRDIRRFVVRALVATALIVPFYLLVPVVAEAKPVVGDGFWETLLRWERAGDAPITAFPAFHLVWACIAAELYARSWRWGWMVWLFVFAVAVSCVTTGMHSVADVAGGAAAFAVVASADRLWEWTRRASERIANSWGEVVIGKVRFMSHGVFAGLGVAIGTPIVLWVGGADLVWWVAGATLFGGLTAAIWAQLIEGSPQLLRPFGYFGGVFGVLAAVVVAAVAGADAWRLLAAYAVGLSFGQGVARVRCLVNGCCHGRPAGDAVGIRYTHPRTRVVRLANLGGVPIHPTQVYAALYAVLVGLVLVRFWVLGAPLAFIAGMYFVLIGLGRFVEEHFRGEPQTPAYRGLRLYQWLTLLFVVAGGVLSVMPSASAPAPGSVSGAGLVVALGLGVVAFLAFGTDFPGSSRRYSRLV
jgi:protein-S-isoprenylcysteine O-methyltransferase Ste14